MFVMKSSACVLRRELRVFEGTRSVALWAHVPVHNMQRTKSTLLLDQLCPQGICNV